MEKTDKTTEEIYQEALDSYLYGGINYTANTLKNADVDDLIQLASDSFFTGHRFAAQELADYKARLEEEFQKFKTGNHVVGIDYLIELIYKV